MKQNAKCPKCGSQDIVHIPRPGSYRSNASVVRVSLLSSVPIAFYMCGECGFVEHWIDSLADVAAVKNRYGTRSE